MRGARQKVRVISRKTMSNDSLHPARTKLVAKAHVKANDGGIVEELLDAGLLRVDEHRAQRVEEGLHEDKEELAGHRVEPVALERGGNVDLLGEMTIHT